MISGQYKFKKKIVLAFLENYNEINGSTHLKLRYFIECATYKIKGQVLTYALSGWKKSFSFVFFARAQKKRLTFILEKPFLCKQILFLSCRHFVCVQGQNKSCFFTIETFFYERCFLILMLGVYFLTISYITIKQLIFL